MKLSLPTARFISCKLGRMDTISDVRDSLATWFKINDHLCARMADMRQSSDRAVRGSIVRVKFARAVKLARKADRVEGRFGGQRYILPQTGR